MLPLLLRLPLPYGLVAPSLAGLVVAQLYESLSVQIMRAAAHSALAHAADNMRHWHVACPNCGCKQNCTRSRCAVACWLHSLGHLKWKSLLALRKRSISPLPLRAAVVFVAAAAAAAAAALPGMQLKHLAK